MKCPLCGGNSTYYHSFSQDDVSFNLQRCNICASLFQEDLNGDFTSFYQKGYYRGDQAYHYHDERDIAKYASAVWRARIKNIRKYIKKGKILDVGCAFGGFLQEASRYFESVGLDVSSYAVQEGKKWRSKKSSYKIFQGDLLNLPNDVTFRPESFDIISMVEVAEHLSSPHDNFKVAFELLSRGGLFLIQTANFNGWQAKRAGVHYHYFLPGHLVYYTSNGLKNCLKKIGFRNFHEFIPVDFGVLPKLIKSRGYFKTYINYLSWFRIIGYHFLSKIYFRGHPLTSSYVLYAFK